MLHMNFNADFRVCEDDLAHPDIFIRDWVFPFDQHQVEMIDKNRLFLHTVNFRLLMSLHDPGERNRWFPSITNNIFYIGSTGLMIDLTGSVFRNDVLSIVAINAYGQPVLLKNTSEFQTPYPMLRAYAITNNQFNYANYDDQGAAEAIANRLGIEKDKPFDFINVEKYGFCSTWWVYKATNPMTREIYFENSNGSPVFGVSVVSGNISGNEVLLLPSRQIGKMNELWPVNVVLMPPPPLPLFRLGDIYKMPFNPIIITESLTVADSVRNSYNNSHDKPIVTTWFHGKTGIEYTDWGPLRDRKVFYYLPVLEDQRRTEEATNTALALYHHLDTIFDKRRLKFQIVTVDQFQKIQIYNSYDFCKLCSDLGVRRPQYIIDFDNGLHDVSAITEKKPIEYLISPIISSHTFALLFAPSAVGKSWLSMSIGMALATGKSVCSKWTVSKARNVLYIAGEMDKDEINNRFLILKKYYNPVAENAGKMKYKICQKDLGSEDGQEEIEEYLEYLDSHETHISLLILDNLNCLVSNGEFKSSWDKFFFWLSKLQQNFSPLAILLVHHTNKGGEFSGTAAIKNRLDLMIKAQSHDPIQEKIDKLSIKENGNQLDKIIMDLKRYYQPEIPMYISYEKVRSLSKKEAMPFTITFNPEKPDSGWVVTEPEYLKNVSDISHSSEQIQQEIHAPDDDTQRTKQNIPRKKKKTFPYVVEILASKETPTFLAYLIEEIKNVDLTKKWRDFDKKEKFIVANYLRVRNGESASMIAKRYGRSIRTIQSALNSKYYKWGTN